MITANVQVRVRSTGDPTEAVAGGGRRRLMERARENVGMLTASTHAGVEKAVDGGGAQGERRTRPRGHQHGGHPRD